MNCRKGSVLASGFRLSKVAAIVSSGRKGSAISHLMEPFVVRSLIYAVWKPTSWTFLQRAWFQRKAPPPQQLHFRKDFEMLPVRRSRSQRYLLQVAFLLMVAVNLAVSGSPTSPAWLCSTPTVKSSGCWITDAGQWLDLSRKLQSQYVIAFLRR